MRYKKYTSRTITVLHLYHLHSESPVCSKPGFRVKETELETAWNRESTASTFLKRKIHLNKINRKVGTHFQQWNSGNKLWVPTADMYRPSQGICTVYMEEVSGERIYRRQQALDAYTLRCSSTVPIPASHVVIKKGLSSCDRYLLTTRKKNHFTFWQESPSTQDYRFTVQRNNQVTKHIP